MGACSCMCDFLLGSNRTHQLVSMWGSPNFNTSIHKYNTTKPESPAQIWLLFIGLYILRFSSSKGPHHSASMLHSCPALWVYSPDGTTHGSQLDHRQQQSQHGNNWCRELILFKPVKCDYYRLCIRGLVPCDFKGCFYLLCETGDSVSEQCVESVTLSGSERSLHEDYSLISVLTKQSQFIIYHI